MVRKIIALIVGLAVAVITVMLVQKLGHHLYPPPEGLDPADEEFMKNYVASLPWGPLSIVIASYVLATLAGGWVAASVAGEKPMLFSGIVALFVLAGAVSTMIIIPHPTWFMVTAVVGIIVAAMVAARFASGRLGGGRVV